MSAISDVQVLAANGAQTFAIRFANWIDRDFEQGIFADERFQINLCVVGNDQSRVADRLFVERIKLGQIPDEGFAEFIQASHTFQQGLAGKISVEQQSLWRAADLNEADEIP